MAKAYTSETIALKNVRLSFPNLDKATKFKADNADEVAKFQASFLLDPSNAEHAAAIKFIKSEALRIAKLEFGDKVPKFGRKELCFGNGDDGDVVYDGYTGMFWIKGKNESRVRIAGRRKSAEGTFVPVQKGDAEWPEAGDYVNANLTIWCQNSHGRKALNGNLVAIQFVKKGVRFGRPEADLDQEFEPLEEGEGDSADESFFD